MDIIFFVVFELSPVISAAVGFWNSRPILSSAGNGNSHTSI